MTDHGEDLRKWRLPRGRHGLPRELVVRSQRERLLAAVVRVTASKGYEATSVADILEEAGVGRESFYELFHDKRDCILAAHAVLVDHLEATVRAAYDEPGPWAGRVRKSIAAMLDWFAADPAAARVTIVELAAVGAVSRERFQEDFGRFIKLLEDGRGDSEPGPDRPHAPELAIGAGFARVYEEVIRGRAAELPKPTGAHLRDARPLPRRRGREDRATPRRRDHRTLNERIRAPFYSRTAKPCAAL